MASPETSTSGASTQPVNSPRTSSQGFTTVQSSLCTHSFTSSAVLMGGGPNLSTDSTSSPHHVSMTAGGSSLPTGNTPSTTPSSTSPPSQSQMSSSTKKTSSTSAATSHPRMDYSTICKGNALNGTLWKEFHMGTWIAYTSNLIPSGKVSFKDYMANNTPGVSQFYCDPGVPCDLITTEDGCNTTPPETNPKNWAIIYSIVNFHNFINIVARSVRRAQATFSSQGLGLMAHFTSDDFKSAINTARNSIASGSLTAAGGIAALVKQANPELTLLAWLGGMVSVGGGASTIDNGVLRGIATATTEVVENQIQEAGNMSAILTGMFTAVENGFSNWGQEMINGIVHQSEESGMFYQQASGIVSWLLNGTFAQHIDPDSNLELDAKALRFFWGPALSLLWRSEGVYFVNTTDAWTFTGDPYETLSIDKDDITRIIHGQDVFFAIKHTSGAAPNKAYTKVPGIDKLDELGLDIHQVIDASAYSLGKIGFNETWPIDQSMYYALSDDPPPHGLFMTIPICQLGQMPHPPQDLLGKKGCDYVDMAPECTLKRYINWSCRKQIEITNGVPQKWPIDLYDPNWSSR